MNPEIISAIVTVGGVFITNLAFMATFFLWSRTESRNDIRHLDNRLESNRELVRAIHDESKEMIQAIHLEMKDFHFKLLEIQKDRKE